LDFNQGGSQESEGNDQDDQDDQDREGLREVSVFVAGLSDQKRCLCSVKRRRQPWSNSTKGILYNAHRCLYARTGEYFEFEFEIEIA
jgi:hypothetical protein